MLNIHVVSVNSGWILQHIARKISEAQLSDAQFTMSTEPSDKADVNYYVDLQNCYFGQRTKCNVALFTHADCDSALWTQALLLDRGIDRLNGIVAMSKRYEKMLVQIGYPESRVTTIVPGDPCLHFRLKPIKIGIAARGGYPGKGQQFMEQFLESCDLSCVQLRIMGKGWDNLLPIAARRQIDMVIDDSEDYTKYQEFYDSIDYLLVPSLWEGGPMGMQEAMACGIPVITSNVGFVGSEINPERVFEAGDVSHLCDIIDCLSGERIKRRAQVDHLNYVAYARQLVEFVKKVGA